MQAYRAVEIQNLQMYVNRCQIFPYLPLLVVCLLPTTAFTPHVETLSPFLFSLLPNGRLRRRLPFGTRGLLLPFLLSWTSGEWLLRRTPTPLLHGKRGEEEVAALLIASPCRTWRSCCSSSTIPAYQVWSTSQDTKHNNSSNKMTELVHHEEGDQMKKISKVSWTSKHHHRHGFIAWAPRGLCPHRGHTLLQPPRWVRLSPLSPYKKGVWKTIILIFVL